MSVADVLIAARKKIERPENWTKGEFARDVAGRYVESRSGPAWCWCAVGAVWAVAEDAAAEEGATLALRDAAGTRTVTAFNDAESTTHADVLALFDRAIQLAKEQTP